MTAALGVQAGARRRVAALPLACGLLLVLSLFAIGLGRYPLSPSQVLQVLWRGVAGMSSVDDVDTPSGKLALALLLAGAPRGNFGVRPDADAALPRIEPGG